MTGESDEQVVDEMWYEDGILFGGVCPVCGDEFIDGFDDIAEGESVEGVRVCVYQKNGDVGHALFHLPEDQDASS